MFQKDRNRVSFKSDNQVSKVVGKTIRDANLKAYDDFYIK